MNASREHDTRWWAFAVLGLPTILISMDQSILYLALPALSRELGATSTESLWIMDMYGFLLAGSLITMGSLGDRIGRRKLLLLGAAVFTVATVVAAFSPTPTALIVARAAMGIAGATLLPSTLALISNIFTNPRERGSAIAAWFSCLMVGGALGPIIGGALLSWFWWGSVFLVGVPIMAVLLVLGPRLLPEYRDPDAGRIDLLSVPLSLGAILPIVYSLKEFATGTGGAAVWVPLLCGVLVGLIFLRRQQVIADPMVDLRLFRSRQLSASLVILFFGSMTTGGMYLVVSLYLQTVEQHSPFIAGLWLLPSTAAIVIGSMAAPALLGRIRINHLVAAGLLVTAAGYLLMTQVPGQGSMLILVAAFVLAFLGLGPMGAVGTDLVVSGAPPQRAGSAASLSESSNHLGIAVGIAAFGSIASAVYRSRMEEVDVPADSAGVKESVMQAATVVRDLPQESLRVFVNDMNEAFVSGMHATAWVGVGLFVALSGIAVVALRGARTPQPSTELPEAEADEVSTAKVFSADDER
ncbi:MFS transporter [Nocardia sp. 004]|uniref:MFS transporter n=1 Tax=Nocardia sp. 004 TaxID=3385978 RepID=UPI00399F9442